MCCVALCQYIEATKFRDGARGNLANEGNPPTTHTPPPLNLSSALTLQPLTWHTLFFVFLSAAPFCYFKFFSQFHSYFLHRCGNLPFLFLRTLISLLLVSLFSSSSLFLTSFSSSWTISWCLTITASVSLTHLNLSPPTLWMTFQYCLGVCITSALLWVQISSICAFLWLIILCFPFYCH